MNWNFDVHQRSETVADDAQIFNHESRTIKAKCSETSCEFLTKLKNGGQCLPFFYVVKYGDTLEVAIRSGILDHGIENHAETVECENIEVLQLSHDWQANGAHWRVFGIDVKPETYS